MNHMDEDYIKKLEQENQLLHSLNEELLEEVNTIPNLREYIIKLKKKHNFYYESYEQAIKGSNLMIKYLVEGKPFKKDNHGLGGPSIVFDISEKYDDRFRTEFTNAGEDFKEEYTEEEVLAAGYKIDSEQNCYYKGKEENIISQFSSAVPIDVDIIYPSQVKNSTIDGLHGGGCVQAGYNLPTGYAEPFPQPPLGFNVWPKHT